eukprot:2516833-Lingulodinium_polyedra.AAC.1
MGLCRSASCLAGTRPRESQSAAGPSERSGRTLPWRARPACPLSVTLRRHGCWQGGPSDCRALGSRLACTA